MAPKRTWTSKLKDIRTNVFVGRDDWLREFSDNFVGQEPRYLLYSVTGEGGVGKSTLLKQFEALAQSASIEAIVVRCDDSHVSPAACMGAIAEQLAKHDIRSKEFDERYKAYRTALQEVESDPKAPRGALDIVIRGAANVGVKALRRVPVAGVAAEFVDEAAVGEVLAQGMNYLVERFGNRDEIRLVREPENILTPLFVRLLDHTSANRRLICLFDVFERTGDMLSPWLLSLLTGKYGDLNLNVTAVVAGRDELAQAWTAIAGAICHVALEPFSPQETAEYLERQGIVDPQLVKAIHADTGGLPVLVELLAARKPKPGVHLPDYASDAVKRFFQWIQDPEQRQAAMLAAIPRQFNRDILSAVLGHDATSIFEWLAEESYIRNSVARGYHYHERVRELICRHIRNTSPNDYKRAHHSMATYYREQQEQSGHNFKSAYAVESWRYCERERVYHEVCRKPDECNLPATEAFLLAIEYRWAFAGEISDLISQAAQEHPATELQRCSALLSRAWSAYAEDDYSDALNQWTALLEMPGLSKIGVRIATACRGDAYRQTDQFEEAIGDFSRALELDPTDTRSLVRRGVLYLEIDKAEEAITDFNQIIDIEPQFTLAWAGRGTAYRRNGKFEEAIADLSRALQIEPNYKYALVIRGKAYLQTGKFEEAMDDFSQALEIDPAYTFVLEVRGEAYCQLRKFDEAIADFSQALKIDPTHKSALAGRGEVYRQILKYEEAIADFSQVLKIDPTHLSALAGRGEVYRQILKHEEAIADFSQVLKIDPTHVFALAGRGETYHQTGKFEEAIADLNQAIEINPDYYWALTSRGEAYRQTGKFEEALADLSKAIGINPNYGRALACRGEAYRQAGKFGEALADLNQAIEFNPNYIWALTSRGEAYRQTGKFEEALADLSNAIELNPNYIWALACRGEAYRQVGKFGEALADLNQAIEFNPNYVWALTSRGEAYRQTGKFEEALADLSNAIELNPNYIWALASRGDVYRRSGKFEEALADLNKAIEIDPNYSWALGERGEALRLTGRYSEAIVDFGRAIDFNGKHSLAIARRASIYLANNDIDAARQDFERARAIPLEDDGDYYANAILDVMDKQYGRAVEMLREAVVRSPGRRFEARRDDLLAPLRYRDDFQEILGQE